MGSVTQMRFPAAWGLNIFNDQKAKCCTFFFAFSRTVYTVHLLFLFVSKENNVCSQSILYWDILSRDKLTA